MTDAVTRSLELVQRAQEGDRAALDQLLERHEARVLAIVRYRLGPRLRESVESGDILQETFMAAVKAFPTFEMRDEGSLIHWLAKLVERQIIAQADYHGAKKREAARRVSLDRTRANAGAFSASVSVVHADETTAPLEKLERAEERAAVERAMDALPDEYRELILLRNYAGASWESVAEQTGRPSAAAARMMHARAMLELAKLLRELGIR
jgi:RNA polymerase sigma-70 factor (ECF subfamily)